MTAIAAISVNGMVVMGGDSAAISDSHYLTLAATPKVFEVGPLVIGYTSSFAMGYALQHRLDLTCEPPKVFKDEDLTALDEWMAVTFTDDVRKVMRACGYMKVENARESGGTFLVGVRGVIYEFDDDFHARRIGAPYAAVGSGVSACLGALHVMQRFNLGSAIPIPAKHAVLHALEAAEACIATVRGPFTIIEGGKE